MLIRTLNSNQQRFFRIRATTPIEITSLTREGSDLVIRCRYHPQINTQTRITFGTRTFNVVGVQNLEERNLELQIIAVEVVT